MDKKLFETVYKDNFNHVYRFAFYMTKSKEDAEDLTSDAFSKLMNYKSSESILNYKFWLLRVTRNMIYDKYKSKEQVLKQVQDDVDIEGGYQEFKEVGHKSLEEEVIDQELMEIIKKEIGKLDEISAEIIALKVWEELKFNEIAEITKLNESTVKLKYYRGIDKIKANIEGSNVKLRSFTLPILLAGIYQFGLLEMFKPEVEFVRNATKALFGVVNVSIIQKVMTKETAAATTGAAVGAGTVGAAASGGILATSLGKVLLGLGGALVIGTAGVAGINLARQEQPKPTPIEEEKPVEKPPVEEKKSIDVSKEFQKAINDKQYDNIRELITDSTDFQIFAYDCCGNLSKDAVLSKLKEEKSELKYDFSQDLPEIVEIKKLANFNTYFKDHIVGINHSHILSYKITNNKVSSIWIFREAFLGKEIMGYETKTFTLKSSAGYSLNIKLNLPKNAKITNVTITDRSTDNYSTFFEKVITLNGMKMYLGIPQEMFTEGFKTVTLIAPIYDKNTYRVLPLTSINKSNINYYVSMRRNALQLSGTCQQFPDSSEYKAPCGVRGFSYNDNLGFLVGCKDDKNKFLSCDIAMKSIVVTHQ